MRTRSMHDPLAIVLAALVCMLGGLALSAVVYGVLAALRGWPRPSRPQVTLFVAANIVGFLVVAAGAF